MSTTPATRPTQRDPLHQLRKYDTRRARRIGRIEGSIAAVLVLVAAPLVADALSPAEPRPAARPAILLTAAEVRP